MPNLYLVVRVGDFMWAELAVDCFEELLSLITLFVFDTHFHVQGWAIPEQSPTETLNQRRQDISKILQYYLDKSTPHVLYRWIGTLAVVLVYATRVYWIQGFYIVTYALGIYILNLLMGFLSPLDDPELESSDGPILPTKDSAEFKPFIRRLPEFRFWYAITKALCIGFVMTFFSMFDIPVFWPVLLFYWIVLFDLTMRRQIMHMIKYKYIPFNLGKQTYRGKTPAANSPRAD